MKKKKGFIFPSLSYSFLKYQYCILVLRLSRDGFFPLIFSSEHNRSEISVHLKKWIQMLTDLKKEQYSHAQTIQFSGSSSQNVEHGKPDKANQKDHEGHKILKQPVQRGRRVFRTGNV